jgi:hypothetical protein
VTEQLRYFKNLKTKKCEPHTGNMDMSEWKEITANQYYDWKGMQPKERTIIDQPHRHGKGDKVDMMLITPDEYNKLQADLAALQRQNAKLLAALEPFAALAEMIMTMDRHFSDDTVWYAANNVEVTWGQMKQAAAIVSEMKGEAT